jgi:hypothetical protein
VLPRKAPWIGQADDIDFGVGSGARAARGRRSP